MRGRHHLASGCPWEYALLGHEYAGRARVAAKRVAEVAEERLSVGPFAGRLSLRDTARPCAASGGGVRSGSMDAPRVNLYLVGFAGTGKSTVGRHAARTLGYTLLDVDHEIEHAQGKPIPQIFAEQGEPAFRAMERAFISSGHPPDGCVVSCGGGLIVPDGMLELLRARGVVICLHASLATILERTGRTNHRPLLAGENREEKLRTLYAAREAIYRRAGTMVLTDSRPLREIVAHVLRVYRQEAREWRPQP